MSNSKTLYFDQRRVIIEYKGEPADPLLIETVISDVCKREKMAEIFPELVFYIETLPRTDGGWVSREEIMLGKNIIHLNITTLDAVPLHKRSQEYRRVIIHELTHLWHDFISKYLTKKFETTTRLAVNLNKKLSIETAPKTFNRVTARLALFDFFRVLPAEGIALYSEKAILGKPITFYNFEEIQKMATELAVKIQERINTGEEFKSLLKELKKNSYTIGLHMVCAILFLGYRSLEYIAKLGPLEFIKEYEKYMLEKGFQPVVSATSGVGILDYKHLVAKVTEAVKNK